MFAGRSRKEEKKEAKREEKKSCTMEVVFILDRSGSMCGLEKDTIGGFNSTLNKHKAESENIIWTTILFDDRLEVIHDRLPIREVKPLTEKEYYVRGCTALLDAIGSAISHAVRVRRHSIRSQIPDKTLFVITTDGMENSSIKYSYREVKKMIRHQQSEYGWEFLFLGANIDAAAEAGRIGIMPSRAATFINDSEGIARNYEAVGCAMETMISGSDFDGSELESVRADFRNRR